MKSFALCVLAVAASACAHNASPSASSRVALFPDENKIKPAAEVYLCERETMVGSNMMEVHCRRQADVQMAQKDSDILLPRVDPQVQDGRW